MVEVATLFSWIVERHVFILLWGDEVVSWAD